MDRTMPTAANAGELWWCRLANGGSNFLARISYIGGIVCAGRPDGKGHFYPVDDPHFVWIGKESPDWVPASNTIANLEIDGPI